MKKQMKAVQAFADRHSLLLGAVLVVFSRQKRLQRP